ncbi:MAG: helix-turn-helix domain-containing protein [Proteobacteria bacterium]|nr:helix-turn-helix domain-containing protein [Pseudomonadota bacterium]
MQSSTGNELAIAMGTVLREERKRQGIRIEVAGKALGITASYISQIETGKKNPTLSVIESYADFLGMDLFELSLRTKIVRSPDKKSLKKLMTDLSGKLEVLADLRKKGTKKKTSITRASGDKLQAKEFPSPL